MQFTFFMPTPPADWTYDIATLHPDRDAKTMITGEVIWVLQSYLRLREKGVPVRLSVNEPITEGVAMTHFNFWNAMKAKIPAGAPVTTVSLRSDKPANPDADLEVVHNPTQVTAEREIFIPHWPQPGIQPRDPSRGNQISLVASKAIPKNTHLHLMSPEFIAELAAMGIGWSVGKVRVIGEKPFTVATNDVWWNYREVDVTVGVRRDLTVPWDGKSASKLVNSWLAGCPAILARESAFRDLRQSPLDYIEVSTAEEVIGAVRGLRDNPDLYASMVAQAHKRAPEFAPDAVTRAWEKGLEQLASLATARGR